MKVYFTSFEILRENYQQPGMVFFRKGMYDEQFRFEFIESKKNRYKRWVNKTTSLSKFNEDLSEEIGMKQVLFLNKMNKFFIFLHFFPISKNSLSIKSNGTCRITKPR